MNNTERQRKFKRKLRDNPEKREIFFKKGREQDRARYQQLKMIQLFSCGENCDLKSCEICSGNSLILMKELFDKDGLNEEVELVQWIQDIYQLRLKTEFKTLNECIEIFQENFVDFKLHTFIKKSQSDFFQQSIKNSSCEKVVVQVDFAEKFKCVAQNEIQSAYYNQQSISIFTVVIWAGTQKYSKVYLTDDTRQNKYCVTLCLNEIMTDLKLALPYLKEVQIFSDGCTGQFKNRWILSLLAFDEDLFGVSMTWNFFAPGHGKGAVDGVGGIVKSAVYRRIMSGKVKVYTSQDFHDCLSASIQGITSKVISVDDIKQLETALADKWKNVKPISEVSSFFMFKKHASKMIEAHGVGSSADYRVFKILN